MLLSRSIAFGGIMLSLIMVFLTVSFFSPVADFALFSMSSLCISLMVLQAGIKGGSGLYAAASVLVTVFFGIKFALPFCAFFGIYPIIKALIEVKAEKKLSYIYKLLFFILITACSIAASLLFLEIFKVPDIIASLFTPSGGSVYLIIGLLSIAVMFVYDFALTTAISITGRFLKKRN